MLPPDTKDFILTSIESDRLSQSPIEKINRIIADMQCGTDPVALYRAINSLNENIEITKDKAIDNVQDQLRKINQKWYEQNLEDLENTPEDPIDIIENIISAYNQIEIFDGCDGDQAKGFKDFAKTCGMYLTGEKALTEHPYKAFDLYSKANAIADIPEDEEVLSLLSAAYIRKLGADIDYIDDEDNLDHINTIMEAAKHYQSLIKRNNNSENLQSIYERLKEKSVEAIQEIYQMSKGKCYMPPESISNNDGYLDHVRCAGAIKELLMLTGDHASKYIDVPAWYKQEDLKADLQAHIRISKAVSESELKAAKEDLHFIRTLGKDQADEILSLKSKLTWLDKTDDLNAQNFVGLFKEKFGYQPKIDGLQSYRQYIEGEIETLSNKAQSLIETLNLDRE